MTFSKRTAALAFIATLPVDQRDGARDAWMNVFVPDNRRRQNLFEGIRRNWFFGERKAGEDFEGEEEGVRDVVKEVRLRRSDESFKYGLARFMGQTRREVAGGG